MSRGWPRWRATWAARGGPRRPAASRGAHVADLFDRYGVHRPEMVRAWVARSGSTRRRLAAGAVAAAARAVGVPSPAERLAGACARLRRGPGIVDLPPGWRSSGSRGCRLVLGSWRRSPPGATCTCCCSTPRRRCGTGSSTRAATGAGRHSPRRPDHICGQPPARLVGAGRRSCNSCSRDGRRRRPPPRAARRTQPRTLLGRCRATSAPTASHPGRRCRRAGRPPAPHARRSQHPDPRLPRARTPGRGAARGDPAPARGRPDARAARRDRDVPGHRDVRAADRGDLRGGPRRSAEDGDDGRTRTPAERPPPDLRVRLADRSLRRTTPILAVVAACSSSPSRVTASEVLDLAARRAGAPPLRLRRRRAHADPRLGAGAGSTGDSTPRAARRSSSDGRRGHLARRASTGCCSASR